MPPPSVMLSMPPPTVNMASPGSVMTTHAPQHINPHSNHMHIQHVVHHHSPWVLERHLRHFFRETNFSSFNLFTEFQDLLTVTKKFIMWLHISYINTITIILQMFRLHGLQDHPSLDPTSPLTKTQTKSRPQLTNTPQTRPKVGVNKCPISKVIKYPMEEDITKVPLEANTHQELSTASLSLWLG